MHIKPLQKFQIKFTTPPPQPQSHLKPKSKSKSNSKSKPKPKRLLVSCMDYRICTDIAQFAKGVGWTKDYDHFILAGASLGFCQPRFKSWKRTLLDHINLGKQFHEITEVAFIDHLGCGMYKKFHEELETKPELEEGLHRKYLQQVSNKLTRKGQIQFHGYIMYQNGEVLKINLSPFEKQEKKKKTERSKSKQKGKRPVRESKVKTTMKTMKGLIQFCKESDRSSDEQSDIDDLTEEDRQFLSDIKTG